MWKLIFIALAFLTLQSCMDVAQSDRIKAYEGPIIDVHLHAALADSNGPPPLSVCPGFAGNLNYDPSISWPQFFVGRMKQPPCDNPITSPETDEGVQQETISELKRLNVRGVLSGPPERVKNWHAEAPNRFIRGRALNIAAEADVTPQMLEAAFRSGEFSVLAEVTNQYAGIFADDPRFETFWEMAAQNDIPVGIHMGLAGPPGVANFTPSARLQRPIHIESVLAKHPNLRVYIMHAGWPFTDDIKGLMYQYPNVYVDTGILQLALTREEYHSFLKELADAGFSDRIMFGSDQMNWPGLIGEGVSAINSAPLSYEQKKAILHDNAIRFLRLND